MLQRMGEEKAFSQVARTGEDMYSALDRYRRMVTTTPRRRQTASNVIN